jgi:hypothetical protein
MVSDMTTTFRAQQIERKIARLKQELLTLGPIHPGSLSRQYNVCGKPGCRCKDPVHPQRHGPYYKVSYVYRGRSTSRFVPRDQVKEVQAELANYKRFRKLTDQWVGLALQLVKEKRKLAE